MSIKDVAERAGVAISTVSNVINGTKYVSKELQLKVMNAIEELNYEVDFFAKGLKSKTTKTIGVVTTGLSSLFFPTMLDNMQEVALEQGYQLLIFTTGLKSEVEKQKVRLLISYKVDGIIIDSTISSNDKDYFNRLGNLALDKKKIPVVSIERDLREYQISSLFTNNFAGGYNATEHLIKSGCKSIAHISGLMNFQISQDRFSGYEKALQNNNLELNPFLISEGNYTLSSGYNAVQNLLKTGEKFDGIFSANDLMAVGAIKALKEHGLLVPNDVKIIGYDNIYISSLVSPSLSTMDFEKINMSIEAVNELIRLIDYQNKFNVSGRYLVKEFPVSLIVRKSTDINSNEVWDILEH